jgi:hypothetical protein
MMEAKYKFTNDRQKYLLFARDVVAFLVSVTIYILTKISEQEYHSNKEIKVYSCN